jgi:hypothetical protein
MFSFNDIDRRFGLQRKTKGRRLQNLRASQGVQHLLFFKQIANRLEASIWYRRFLFFSGPRGTRQEKPQN